MESVVPSEEVFLRVQRSIGIILERNELFWKYLSLNEVNLKEIISIIQPNFALIKRVAAEWAALSQHFPINRRWKFYYLCFTVFVKN